jgi:hypothetical protein
VAVSRIAVQGGLGHEGSGERFWPGGDDRLASRPLRRSASTAGDANAHSIGTAEQHAEHQRQAAR